MARGLGNNYGVDTGSNPSRQPTPPTPFEQQMIAIGAMQNPEPYDPNAVVMNAEPGGPVAPPPLSTEQWIAAHDTGRPGNPLTSPSHIAQELGSGLVQRNIPASEVRGAIGGVARGATGGFLKNLGRGLQLIWDQS